MKYKFKEEDILELISEAGFGAEIGATAICKGYDNILGVMKVKVEWIRENPKCHGQQNGGYDEDNFRLLEMSNDNEEENSLYLLLSPYTALTENETDLQLEQRLDKIDKLPENLKVVMTAVETTEKIRLIIGEKYNLELSDGEKCAYLIRLIFLGELVLSDFVSKLTEELKIDKELAKNIALDIDKEIFQEVAPELEEIQKKLAILRKS